MEKPASMLQREFKSRLIETINTSGLPAFVLVPILESALNEVRLAEENQYIADKEEYENSLLKSEDVDGDGGQ